MQAHEDPRETAIREAEEEIGVKMELLDVIGIYTADRGDENSGIGFVFKAKLGSGAIKPGEGEIAELGFFPAVKSNN